MTLEEMKARKRELGYTNEQLSELSGVPLGTVIKIFGGATTSPRRATITALEAVLQPKKPCSYRFPKSQPDMLKDSAVSYGSSQKKYTLDDYYNLPDDARVELIDGVLYDMAAPTWNHQAIITEIAMQLYACQKAHNAPCRVAMGPVDVQLDKDRYTVLQPDILILCDIQKIKNGICYGAPDMTIEVLSPSSRSHDMILKLNKYKAAGVREYWIVDAEHKKVLVYLFEDKNVFSTYDFSDRIPVSISDGVCEIDFVEVEKMMVKQGDGSSFHPWNEEPSPCFTYTHTQPAHASPASRRHILH